MDYDIIWHKAFQGYSENDVCRKIVSINTGPSVTNILIAPWSTVIPYTVNMVKNDQHGVKVTL